MRTLIVSLSLFAFGLLGAGLDTRVLADGGGGEDAGNSADAAMLLSPAVDSTNTYERNTMGDDDDEDWYRFSTGPGQTLAVTMSGGLASSWTYFSVYDPKFPNYVLRQDRFDPGQPSKTLYWLSSNTAPSEYYLRVYHACINCGDREYQFQVVLHQNSDGNRPGDAGDTLEAAQLITPAAGATTTYADNRLGGDDLEDWYKFTAVSGQTITVTLDYELIHSFGLEYTIYDKMCRDKLANGTLDPDSGSKSHSWVVDAPCRTEYCLQLSNRCTNCDPLGYKFQVRVASPRLKTDSIGRHDGWVRESSESSGKGGMKNDSDSTILVGDDGANRQYRGILSFNTSVVPDNAVISYAELKFVGSRIVGGNPFRTHGVLYADLTRGAFSGANSLDLTDFQASATRPAFAKIPAPGALGVGIYTAQLCSGVADVINKKGLTQFRLRYAKDDDNDHRVDLLSFFSGNATGAFRPFRPSLEVFYTLP